MRARLRQRLFFSLTPKTLGVENVCAAALARGGMTAKFDQAVEIVNAYYTEAAYQLADGYAVENSYYGVYPKIGGTFDSPLSAIDPVRNKIEFAFRVLRKLQKVADEVRIDLLGLANVEGYVAEVLDVSSGSVDRDITSGGMVAITGHKFQQKICQTPRMSLDIIRVILY
ncbi:DNA-binding domain-containing protein [Treponema endosymbiont of Eucomonympha sp.]|uniref:DNA-binding domain-containing protein n=1 Tax=Treponema endosymbiont of Eucomonympha sp. TaxID=1580831 RepID=UPI00139681E5|nr:DNA-binding domain-containing protein [Treponema endosymbiont of Eucomonympha sp.]